MGTLHGSNRSSGGSVIAEVGAAIATRLGARTTVTRSAIIAARARITPGIALSVALPITARPALRIVTRLGAGAVRTAARERLTRKRCAAVPARGDGVEVGGWGERDRGRIASGFGGRRFVAALAVFRERFAGQDDWFGGWVGLGIGAGDGAG